MSVAKIINVQIIEHKETGLLLGISEDMKGLYVHARSELELETSIPDAIKEILEAEGKHNVQVMRVEDDEPVKLPPAFSTNRPIRKFALAA